MLRLTFIFLIIAFGIYWAAQGAFYALLFYIWNAYFRPEEWIWWQADFIRSLRLSYTIGAYLVLRTILSQPNWKLNLRTGLIGLFLLQAVIGCVTSENPAGSWNFLNDFWKVLLISYLIVVLVEDRRQLRTVLLVMALSLGFECAKQGWTTLILAPGSKNDNPIGFLGDNNGVALGTMMLVPLFGALAQTASTKWERYMHRFLAVGVFLRGFTTYSRGGFLAALTLGLFTFIRSQQKIPALVGVVSVGVLVWNVMPQEFWDRMQTINAPEGERDESQEGRLHFWQVAVDMAGAKPMTGVGLAGFEASYESYNSTGKFGGVRATHSAWFGVLADLGFPGLILFVGNLAFALWGCWRVQWAARGDPAARDLRLYANALFTSIVTYSVAASFLSNQYNEMLWHFVGASTAVYLVSRNERATVPAVVRAPVARVGPAAALSQYFRPSPLPPNASRR